MWHITFTIKSLSWWNLFPANLRFTIFSELGENSSNVLNGFCCLQTPCTLPCTCKMLAKKTNRKRKVPFVNMLRAPKKSCPPKRNHIYIIYISLSLDTQRQTDCSGWTSVCLLLHFLLWFSPLLSHLVLEIRNSIHSYNLTVLVPDCDANLLPPLGDCNVDHVVPSHIPFQLFESRKLKRYIQSCMQIMSSHNFKPDCMDSSTLASQHRKKY